MISESLSLDSQGRHSQLISLWWDCTENCSCLSRTGSREHDRNPRQGSFQQTILLVRPHLLGQGQSSVACTSSSQAPPPKDSILSQKQCHHLENKYSDHEELELGSTSSFSITFQHYSKRSTCCLGNSYIKHKFLFVFVSHGSLLLIIQLLEHRVMLKQQHPMITGDDTVIVINSVIML